MEACARRVLALFFVVSLPVAGVSDALAVGNGSDQSPYEIPEVRSDVRIDGVLDEAVWREALTLELGYETSPGENVQPKARTEVLLASSRTHLYVAYRAYDPDPSAICANITDRDNMYDDDRLSFILDTFNDQRRGYMFFVNPYGIQGDALDSYGMGGGDPAWDTIWDSEGRITDDGFVVECAVPFSSLRFQRSEGKQVWGIGLGRKYSRDFDYRMSLTPSNRDETCYLCQIAKFMGFEGATPGRNIELDPTLSTLKTQSHEDARDGWFGGGETQTDAGLTARWGVTPNLVLSGAANPDFSQVETDEIQLEANTQFTLYYEEKRPFFLEGMEHFQMRLNPVYTRTISDPSWGLKLTGKEGSNALGAFVVRDDITNFIVPGNQGSWSASLDQPVTDAAVRYRMDLASASTAGLVFTARNGDGYRNLVGGLDSNLRFTPSDRLEVQALGSRTDYPDDFAADAGQRTGEFDGSAYYVEINHDSSNLDWWAAYRRIGGGFRADMGYRPQTDYKQVRGGWAYAWRAEAGHCSTVLSSGSATSTTRNSAALRWSATSTTGSTTPGRSGPNSMSTASWATRPTTVPSTTTLARRSAWASGPAALRTWASTPHSATPWTTPTDVPRPGSMSNRSCCSSSQDGWTSLRHMKTNAWMWTRAGWTRPTSATSGRRISSPGARSSGPSSSTRTSSPPSTSTRTTGKPGTGASPARSCSPTSSTPRRCSIWDTPTTTRTTRGTTWLGATGPFFAKVGYAWVL